MGNEIKPKPKTCFAYMRTSADGSDETMQREAIQKWCGENGYTIVQFYYDKSYSGDRADRPAMQEMLESLNENITAVICYQLSRLSRSLSGTFKAIEYIHETSGLITITEGINTVKSDNPNPIASEMMITCFSLCSSLELSLVRERVKNGVASARKRGVRFGRKPVVVPNEAYQEYKTGKYGLRTLSKKYHVSTATLSRRFRELDLIAAS